MGFCIFLPDAVKPDVRGQNDPCHPITERGRTMKRLLKSMICGLAVSCLLALTGVAGACEEVSREVFRLHILANSDSEEDQQLKLTVRDRLLQVTAPMFENCRSKEEASREAERNLDRIQEIAQQVVYDCGYNYQVTAKVTKMYFPARKYENFTLPAGEYDALRLVIGEGKGHNWWCVLFPALCLPSAAERAWTGIGGGGEEDLVIRPEEYEYRLKVVEAFSWLCTVFRHG